MSYKPDLKHRKEITLDIKKLLHIFQYNDNLNYSYNSYYGLYTVYYDFPDEINYTTDSEEVYIKDKECFCEFFISDEKMIFLFKTSCYSYASTKDYYDLVWALTMKKTDQEKFDFYLDKLVSETNRLL